MTAKTVGIISSILYGLFGAVLFEMCRELANRSYVLFGIVPTTPDHILWGGIVALGILVFAIHLLRKKSSNQNP